MSDGRYTPVDSPDETTVFDYHDLTPPTRRDIYEARRTVRQHLPQSPLVRSDALSAELDADVHLKREDVLPTGSFKVRGMLTLMAGLDEAFRDRGVITASTGNHGQGAAYAAREFGVPARIVIPEGVENPTKVDAIERLGAEIVRDGRDFDEAREAAERLAAEERYRFIHSGNESELLAGRATAGLEVMEDLPETDVLVNPVGGGSSAAAYCLTVGDVLGADVYGVQPTGADAVYRAWKDGVVEYQDEVETFAEGMMVRTPFALPLQVLDEHLSDMVRVDDDALRDGVRRLLTGDSILAEGAGGAAVAAALERSDELAEKTVVLVVSGGNMDPAKLSDLLAG